MAGFNEFKDKVLVTLGNVADSTKELANSAADAAKKSGRMAKLSMEIASEKDSMKKTYIEIGKLYYDTHKDDPEGFFIQLCEEIALAQKNIDDKEAEIEFLKANSNDGEEKDIEVEFEDIVAEDEAACCEAKDDCEAEDFAEEQADENEAE